MEISEGAGRPGAKWRNIGLLIVAEILAMSVWFAGAAAAPALTRRFGSTSADIGLLTTAVQAGFVTGTLASAVLLVADRFDPRRVFAVGAFVAAVSNVLVLLGGPDSLIGLAGRFLAGMTMAAVYPIGMKIAAGWAIGDMGLMIGLLVGALTLGSSSSQALSLIDTVSWTTPFIASSVCALLAGVIVLGVQLGPALPTRSPGFRVRDVLHVWRSPALRLVNAGYLGHMWELYAMWAWVGVFLTESFQSSMQATDAVALGKIIATLVIASGAVGCVIAGYLADRVGRTVVTIAAMAASGASAIAAGLLFGANPWLLSAVCIVWGVTIVADSAQFSACAVELTERELVGTTLTAQTCLGFLLTLATIQAVPAVVDMIGWTLTIPILALGPAFGIMAMARLRRLPESACLAQGRR